MGVLDTYVMEQMTEKCQQMAGGIGLQTGEKRFYSSVIDELVFHAYVCYGYQLISSWLEATNYLDYWLVPRK